MPEFVDEIVAPHFLEYLDAKVRLDALSKKVQLDLSRLDYPKEDWVPPFQHHLGTSVVDVVIVGAGQGGLAAGLALWRERIRNILIIDQAKEGSEGPWMTFARMKTLRTPKYLTGPDTGIPDLTFNAWYSARFSSPEWSDVLRIPREMWMVYLQWFRASLDLPIKNRTRLISVVPDVPGCLALTLEGPNGIQKVFTRKLILANGLEGSGRWHVPLDLSAHLPKNLWMHTSDI
ncbi:MAG: FAD/NAD(P)-binding protein, partial [Planktomarina sp.]|nr:FAD/NAD(P)-binding protein [Planktomarina sp.]